MSQIEVQLAAPPLLERDGELDALSAVLAGAREGTGAVAVVEGTPGIGKSSLLDAAVARARAAGMQTLRARGGASERDLPFGVALQLFEPRLAASGDDERATLLSGAAALAAPLFEGRAWGRSLPDDHGALGSLIHGLHWLVTNLAGQRPLLLAIDDAHWSDAASLRALLYVAARIEDVPVALVLTRRPGGAAAVGDLLDRFAAHPGASVLRPGPFSERATAAYVRTSAFPGADDAFVAACAEATGGNPLLLCELLHAVRAGAVTPDADEVRRLAPDSVARSVLLRLDTLAPAAAALARAAAVLGDDVRFGHAAALAGLDPDEAARAADALADAAVLTRSEPLTFAHPVVRSAVLGDVAVDERRRLHLRAAALLHAAGVAVERVAAQLLESPCAGEPWAADALRVAADRALARGVPETAAKHLSRLLEEPLDDPARVRTLLDLGRVRLMSGDPDALAPFDAARALGAGPETTAEALYGQAQARFALGQIEAAVDALREGLAVAAPRSRTARSLRALFVGVAALVPDLRGEALEHAQAVATAQGLLDLSDRAVLATLAAQHVFTVQPHERARDLARRALGDGELIAAESSDGLNWTQANAVLTWTDDLVTAIAQTTAAIADARRRGSVTGFATASYCRATPHFWAGRLADAAADAQQALDGRRYGWAMYVAPAAAVLAWALVEQDDLVGAESALEPVLAELDAMLPQFAAYALHARGRLRAARGDHAGALADHLAAGERLATPNPALFPWRSSAAEAALALGDAAHAARLAAAELEQAEAFGAPRALGIALRASGLVAGGEAGIERLTRAVAMLERSPATLERVRALTDLGVAWHAAGEVERARSILRRALDQADRCGARAIAARARAELVRTGARPRRAQLTGVAALTPAERRTAELAARGLSNREVAEALFVTMKTVEWHLRHAYAKLGISGRPELAAALAEG